MKKLIIFFILAMVSVGSYSQTEKQDFSKDYYFQKSKNQRTVGWVLLGAGAAVGTVGLIVASNGDFWDDSSGLGTGLTLFTVGAASTLASIPFFIIAGSNSRKAASLSLESQRFIIPGQEISGIQPGLSLKIEL